MHFAEGQDQKVQGDGGASDSSRTVSSFVISALMIAYVCVSVQRVCERRDGLSALAARAIDNANQG